MWYTVGKHVIRKHRNIYTAIYTPLHFTRGPPLLQIQIADRYSRAGRTEAALGRCAGPRGWHRGGEGIAGLWGCGRAAGRHHEVARAAHEGHEGHEGRDGGTMGAGGVHKGRTRAVQAAHWARERGAQRAREGRGHARGAYSIRGAREAAHAGRKACKGHTGHARGVRGTPCECGGGVTRASWALSWRGGRHRGGTGITKRGTGIMNLKCGAGITKGGAGITKNSVIARMAGASQGRREHCEGVRSVAKVVRAVSPGRRWHHHDVGGILNVAGTS
ncbi:hypothetical protein DENSPDRAFT_852539 [Dentipellis sp. KUC8613]|nr:hypothetical protein DENSPDRAFT_852539 [Dentipellis sp. KUC8613]